MAFGGFRLGGGLIRRWSLLVAIVVGVAVSLFSAVQMKEYAKTHVETERVPVPVRDIPPYTVISNEDLTWRAVAKGGVDPGAARSFSEVVGKIPVATLYKGEQIEKRRLADISLAKGKQVVSVNVDVTRSVGGSLQAGDIVDVWWVPTEGTYAPGAGWIKVASNAVVLDIRDSTGRSVLQRGSVQQAIAGSVGIPSSPPSVAVLVVNSSEVPMLVGGATPKSQNVVLTKKFAPSSEAPESAAQAPQTGQVGQTGGGVVAEESGGSTAQAGQ